MKKNVFCFLNIKILSLSLVVLILGACGGKHQDTPSVVDSNEPTYYSIIDFAKDQWNTYQGQPYLIRKTVTVNGKTDSVETSALNFKWSQMFKIFFETDISDPNFLGKYDFSTFQEDVTQTRTFEYVAKEPELFTQKFQVSVDLFTNKIRSIYIETYRGNFWNTQTQKLFYSPVRVIQIQEHNDPLIGGAKDVVVKCTFQ